jgi:hypothetical protein
VSNLHDERRHSPDIKASDSGHIQAVTISDRTLSVVAIIFACLALGAVVMHAILYPQIVDAKIAAGVARAEVIANQARVDARYATAEIESLRTQLAGKGITIPKEH